MPKNWRTQQSQDHYFQQAKKDGYRARSAYKLLQIDERFHILHPGITVLDLGAAPGSWSQVVSHRVPKSQIVAIDLLPMQPIPGVHIIRGDITKPEYVAQMHQAMPNGADLVLCDAAPNTSGIAFVDHAGSINLGLASLQIAQEFLREGGAFVVKIFQGEDMPKFVKLTRQFFQTVSVFRPDASRQESTEHFIVGLKMKDKATTRLIERML